MRLILLAILLISSPSFASDISWKEVSPQCIECIAFQKSFESMRTVNPENISMERREEVSVEGQRKITAFIKRTKLTHANQIESLVSAWAQIAWADGSHIIAMDAGGLLTKILGSHEKAEQKLKAIKKEAIVRMTPGATSENKKLYALVTSINQAILENHR